LIESILEAERVGGPKDSLEPIAGNYATDNEAFEAAKERGRQLDNAREIVKRPIGDIVKYRYAKETAARVIEASQAIADHLAAGWPDVSASTIAKAVAASKPEKEPMVDRGLRKSDGTPLDVRDLGIPRRMSPGEILR